MGLTDWAKSIIAEFKATQAKRVAENKLLKEKYDNAYNKSYGIEMVKIAAVKGKADAQSKQKGGGFLTDIIGEEGKEQQKKEDFIGEIPKAEVKDEWLGMEDDGEGLSKAE